MNLHRRNRWVQVLYPLFAYYVLYYVSDEIALSYLGEGREMLALLFATVVTLGPIALLYHRALPSKEDIPKTRKEWLMEGLYILGIALLGLKINLFAQNLPLLEYSSGYGKASYVLSSGSIFLRILVLGILTPFLEELVFRGLILGQMLDWMDVKWAVVISSALFGILHFNVVQFLYATIMGVLLGALYVKTQKVWATWAAHGLCNLLVLFLIG
jgi:membrane protease YdiL (CAAX protease family)